MRKKRKVADKIVVPVAVTRAEHLRPLADYLRDTLVTPAMLSKRWGYSEDHLANLRRAQKGPPWIRLDTGGSRGGIRYRLSDVIAAELEGTRGRVSLEQVRMTISACSEVPPEGRARLIQLLDTIFG